MVLVGTDVDYHEDHYHEVVVVAAAAADYNTQLVLQEALADSVVVAAEWCCTVVVVVADNSPDLEIAVSVGNVDAADFASGLHIQDFHVVVAVGAAAMEAFGQEVEVECFLEHEPEKDSELDIDALV
jgi:hypothetical protein